MTGVWVSKFGMVVCVAVGFLPTVAGSSCSAPAALFFTARKLGSLLPELFLPFDAFAAFSSILRQSTTIFDLPAKEVFFSTWLYYPVFFFFSALF